MLIWIGDPHADHQRQTFAKSLALLHKALQCSSVPDCQTFTKGRLPHLLYIQSCCAGAFDSFLNIQITLVLLAQLTICMSFAIGSYAWRQTRGYDNYYLQFDQYSNGNYQNGFVYVIILFITFWILFSYLVPISLFVTIEIIKFVLVSLLLSATYYMML